MEDVEAKKNQRIIAEPTNCYDIFAGEFSVWRDVESVWHIEKSTDEHTTQPT